MQPHDSRLRFYEARRIFGKSVIHQVALVFAILFIVSVVGNIVAVHNFETARRGHVMQVQSYLRRLHVEFYFSATNRDFTSDIAREGLFRQTLGVIEALDTAIWSLGNHHNFRYGAPTTRSASFSFNSALHSTYMIAEDPSINLQILADKMYTLINNLELTGEIEDSHMPTQVLFDAIQETFREIENELGFWGTRR